MEGPIEKRVRCREPQVAGVPARPTISPARTSRAPGAERLRTDGCRGRRRLPERESVVSHQQIALGVLEIGAVTLDAWTRRRRE